MLRIEASMGSPNQPSPRSYQLRRTRHVGRNKQIEYDAYWDEVLTVSMNIATLGVYHTLEFFYRTHL
jgi:hypothetical protein